MIIRVDDKSIIITEDAPILLNLKAAKIGEIETRSGNFSWSFTLPNTPDNFIALKEVTKLTTENKLFFTKLSATLEDNESNIVDSGYLLIESFNEQKIKCRFISGNFDWIQSLQTLKIKDLETLVTLDHDYTEANITASATHTTDDGYIYCPIASGIDHSDGYSIKALAGLAIELLTFWEWVPSLFCHQLVKRIFDAQGIKVVGDLMNDPNFKNMVLPCSDGVYITEATAEQNNAFVGKSANQTPGSAGFTDTTVTFDLETSPYYDTGGNFASNEYTVPVNGVIDLTFLIISGGNIATPEYTQIILTRGANTFVLVDYISSDKDSNRGTIRIRVQANDTIKLIRPGTILGAGNHTIYAGTTLKFTYTTFSVEGSPMEFAATAPDMLQSDFLKAVFNIFAVVPSYDTQQKVLTLNTFDSIYDNVGSAKDWSDKIDISKSWEVDIVKSTQNYAQSMVFKYADDSLDEQVNSYDSVNITPFGQGNLTIDNDLLDEEKTAFQSVIAPTLTIVPNGANGGELDNYLPYIPMFTSETKTFEELEVGDFVTNDYGGTPGTNSYYVTYKDGSGNGYTDGYVAAGTQRLITSATEPFTVVTRQKPVYRFLVLTGTTTTFYDYTSKLAYFYNNMLSSDLGELNGFTPSFGSANVNLFSGVYDPMNAIELYWRNFERMINAPKELEAVFRLDATDIYNLDFSIPVYIKYFDSYFYINEIKNYNGIFGTVELIYLT